MPHWGRDINHGATYFLDSDDKLENYSYLVPEQNVEKYLGISFEEKSRLKFYSALPASCEVIIPIDRDEYNDPEFSGELEYKHVDVYMCGMLDYFSKEKLSRARQNYADPIEIELSKAWGKGYYVYLLYEDNKLDYEPIYVGQSTNVVSRIGNHATNKLLKNVVRCRVLVCHSHRQMNVLESALINRYLPSVNIKGINDFESYELIPHGFGPFYF